MTDKTDFVKIRVHILIDHDKHFIYEDGKIVDSGACSPTIPFHVDPPFR